MSSKRQTTPAKDLERNAKGSCISRCLVVFYGFFSIVFYQKDELAECMIGFGDALGKDMKTADLLFQSVNFWNLVQVHFPAFQEFEAR